MLCQFYRKLLGTLDKDYIQTRLLEKEPFVGNWNILHDPILFDFLVKAIQVEKVMLRKYNERPFRCICRSIKNSNQVYLFHHYKLDDHCANDINNIVSSFIIEDGRNKLKDKYRKFFLFQQTDLIPDVILYVANIYFIV